MTPKLGTVYDFFYHVCICAQAPPITVHRMVESKMKKTVWRKRIRVTPYIYVYTDMYWAHPGIYLVFENARPPILCHAIKFLSIVYKCTDTSPKHSTLYFGAESEKKICADHEYLQPLIMLIHTRIFSYILVYTGIYSYIPVHTIKSGWSRLQVAMTYRLCSVCCTLEPCIAHSILPFWGVFDGQASQAGRATPKLPQPQVDLIDIAAPPSVRCSLVGTAIREAWILALAEHVRDCWSRVASKKQWDKKNSAHHILGIGHVEAGGWDWFIELDHSSVLHKPVDRQFELFKGTYEIQGVYSVIRAGFVGSFLGNLPSFGRRTGDGHTSSPPRKHRVCPLRWSKDKEGLQVWYPAHRNTAYLRLYWTMLWYTTYIWIYTVIYKGYKCIYWHEILRNGWQTFGLKE